MRNAAILSVILAIATSLWTWWPQKAESLTTESEVGKLFNKDPETKASPENVGYLRVASWDDESKSAKVFSVEKRDNKWIIPSHFDYPADGGTRVGDTAGTVLNVPRGRLVTSDPKRHAELGVIDPLKGGTADSEGRGKRVTVKDVGGAILADLIVGGQSEQGSVYYVREDGDDNVYTADINPDISTKFKDWVETDPFKISNGDIRSLDILDREVDEKTRQVKVRGETNLKKPKDASDWTSPQTPEHKKPKVDTIDDLKTEVSSLKLVGVRPYSPLWLQARGFYVTQDKQLVGNMGSLRVGTKDGLMHFLFFGEIAVGDEEDTTAEMKKKDGEAEKKDDKKEARKDEDKKDHNRYMAAFVRYVPGLDDDVLEQEKKLKEQQDKQNKKDAKEKDKEDAKKEIEKIEKKLKELKKKGTEKAQKKLQRFTQFFYVISDDSFKKMRPSGDKLWVWKDVKKEELPGEKVAKDKDLEKKDDDLQYVDLKEGKGDEAEDGDTLEVHYTGWTYDDKKKFDSSVDRKEPFKIVLGAGQVIKGWEKGLKGMKVGGKRKLVIPPELGYGKAGSGEKIPGNARLVFDVELLKLTKKGKEDSGDKKDEKKEEKKDDAAKADEKKDEVKKDAKEPVKEEKKEKKAEK